MARTVEILGQEFTVYHFAGDTTDVVLDPCWKCNGDKILRHYLHVFGGECFACRATGGTYLTVEQMTKRIKGRQQRAAAKVRKADQAARRLLADLAFFADTQPELAFMTTDAIYEEEMDAFPILRDMGQRLQARGALSDKQIAFAYRLIAQAQERQERREAQKAMAKPAPIGRVEIEGKVVKAVEQRTYHGFSEQINTRITVVTDEGWLANGNAPSALMIAAWSDRGAFDGDAEENLVGRRVRFTATTELPKPKGDQAPDPTFVFFKRPIKGELVQEEVVNLDA